MFSFEKKEAWQCHMTKKANISFNNSSDRLNWIHDFHAFYVDGVLSIKCGNIERRLFLKVND